MRSSTLHSSTRTAHSSQPNARRGALVGAALVLLFYAAAIPVIIDHLGTQSRAAFDQRDFHEPVVRQFIAQWPHPDLSDYLSSTTPGYHLFVSAVARVTSRSLESLRFIGSLFTAGLLFTLGCAVGRRQRFAAALLICLPVVCSNYVFTSGAFLLPENAGWWGVLAVLLLALRGKTNPWTCVLAGLVLLALVWVRQSHLWAAAPLMMAAFLGNPTENDLRASEPLARRTIRVGWMALAIVPSLLSLAYFRHLWHGALVPPNQVHLTAGGNLAAPAVILAIAGVMGLFYWTAFQAQRNERQGSGNSAVDEPQFGARSPIRAGIIIALGAMAGLLIGLIPESTYGVEVRRFGGIWNAVRHFPYILHRSPLLILLAGLGGAMITGWLLSLPRRDRWIWLTAAFAFTAAQLASANPWHRYYEPLILIAAALTTPPLPLHRDTRPHRLALLGPALLSLLLALITAQSLR